MARDKEKKAAYDKAYRQANKERRATTAREWRTANKEKMLGLQKTWRQNNKAKVNATSKAYKETKRDNNFIITELDKFVEQEIYELAQIRTEQLGKEWHVDHTIPLSKGGPHAIHNLEVVPKAWNLSKGNSHSNRYREVL